MSNITFQISCKKPPLSNITNLAHVNAKTHVVIEKRCYENERAVPDMNREKPKWREISNEFQKRQQYSLRFNHKYKGSKWTLLKDYWKNFLILHTHSFGYPSSDLEDGALLEAMSNMMLLKAVREWRGDPAKWWWKPVEDGGAKAITTSRQRRITLKQVLELNTSCGSATKMNRTCKRITRLVKEGVPVCIWHINETYNGQREL